VRWDAAVIDMGQLMLIDRPNISSTFRRPFNRRAGSWSSNNVPAEATINCSGINEGGTMQLIDTRVGVNKDHRCWRVRRAMRFPSDWPKGAQDQDAAPPADAIAVQLIRFAQPFGDATGQAVLRRRRPAAAGSPRQSDRMSQEGRPGRRLSANCCTPAFPRSGAAGVHGDIRAEDKGPRMPHPQAVVRWRARIAAPPRRPIAARTWPKTRGSARYPAISGEMSSTLRAAATSTGGLRR